MRRDNTGSEASDAQARRLAATVEECSDAVIVQALDGRILGWNRGAERMYGYSEDEALQMSVGTLVPAEGRAQALERLGAIARGDEVASVEVARVAKDGRRLDVRLTATALVDDEGRPVGVVNTERDITDHKRALEALRETAEAQRKDLALLRALANSIPDPVFVKDDQCRMLFANPSTLEAIGKAATEVLGRSDREFFDDEQSGAAIVETDRRIMSTGETETVEESIETPSGRRWYLSTKAPFRDAAGKVIGIIGVTREITARKRAEEALRESEERFRAFVTASSDVVYRMSPDWSELRELRGREFVSDTDTPSRGWIVTYVHPIDRPHVTEVISEAIRTKSVAQMEHRVVRVDGSMGWAFSRAVPLLDEGGAIVEWLGAAIDITARKQAEEALRESEERYRSLFEHMTEGLAYCRMLFEGDRPVDFVYLDVNPAFETLTGLRGVVGKKVSEVIPGIQKSDPGLIERYGRVARQGTPERFEIYIAAIGHWFDISVYSPARGDFVAIFDIITQRKRAEDELRASEGRLRMAKDAAKMGAWNWDVVSGEQVWSDRCKALFGLSPDTVVSYPVFLAAVHCEDRDRIDRAVKDALTKKEPYEVEMRVPRPDGTIAWIASKGEFVFAPDGRAVRMDGMAMDVTERKHAEELVREANDKLRDADRNKDQFLAMLSHELRNPLTPIRNSLYILDRATPGGQQARKARETIQRQIGHLTWLVDDLLDVTRIAHGKIQLQRERLDLNQLAHRVVEDHRAIFAKSDVRLEVLPAPAEVWVDGDRVRLVQVISNLLQNAAKFTPHGGKTTVSVESSRSRHQAFLTVRDTGRGIQPEMMPRLFQAFSQVDSTIDRSKGGLGLGLALVKGLVGMHGGSVTASSDGSGKGTAFTITLPLDVAEARLASAAGAVDGARSTPRRVLVIEDNEDTANTLREVLEFDEHVVDVAYTGLDGIERARAFHPDVVLCDISLPDMDGYEVARAMRAAPEIAGVGLVALSGYAQPEDVAIAREAGFDEHLAKPPSIEALARAVAEFGGARQELRTPARASDSSSRT